MSKLSICIPTYNQIEILRRNIENLLQYPGDDIQIVVSDNCSEDDIKGMLDAFQDSRIKYCRTKTNVGQDRNILNGLRNCDSPYAFLLRTKDTIIPEKIPAIIKTAYEHPEVGYWRFAPVDENGHARGAFPTRIYRAGAEAAAAVETWMKHPSGELYQVALLQEEDYQEIDRWIERWFPNNLGFIVHTILQIKIYCKAGAGLSGDYVWVYLSPKEEAKGTVNLAGKKSVYAPEYLYPRYACELEWVHQMCPEPVQAVLYKKILRRYCQAATVAYKYINKDKLLQDHYQCEEQPFSIAQERKVFYEKTQEILQGYPAETQKKLKRYAKFCLSGMQLRWEVSRVLGPLIKERLMGVIADRKRKK